MRKLAITIATTALLLAVTATAAQAYTTEVFNSTTSELCGVNPVNCEIDIQGQVYVGDGTVYPCYVDGSGRVVNGGETGVEGDSETASIVIDDVDAYCSGVNVTECHDGSFGPITPWQGQIAAVEVDPFTYAAEYEATLTPCLEFAYNSEPHYTDQFTFPIDITNDGATWDFGAASPQEGDWLSNPSFDIDNAPILAAW